MFKRAVTLTVLIVAAAFPAGAGAAERWSVRGAGWGHGIGMSQWGAYGYAKHGAGYRDIIDHYYRDTKVGSVTNGDVRVLLQPNKSTILFRHATQAGDRGLTEDSVYKATRDGNNVILRSASGRQLEIFDGVMRVVGGKHVRLLGRADNGVPDGLYRGALEIRTASGSGLNAISALDLESYLLGVVPGESPAAWPAAALEAQAVAARSYALASNVNGKGFDQYADTRSQMYRGYLAETPATNAAVANTAGQVVTYNGEIADHLLLLHIRRLHRERRERLHRRLPEAVAEGRRRIPTTTTRPITAGVHTHIHAPQSRASWAAGSRAS